MAVSWEEYHWFRETKRLNQQSERPPIESAAGIAPDFFLFSSFAFVSGDETHDLTPYLRQTH